MCRVGSIPEVEELRGRRDAQSLNCDIRRYGGGDSAVCKATRYEHRMLSLEWLVGGDFELWPNGSYMMKKSVIKGAVETGKTSVLDLFVDKRRGIAGLDKKRQTGESKCIQLSCCFHFNWRLLQIVISRIAFGNNGIVRWFLAYEVDLNGVYNGC